MPRWFRRWRRRREIRRLARADHYDTVEQEEVEGEAFSFSINDPIGCWLPSLEAWLQQKASEGVVW